MSPWLKEGYCQLAPASIPAHHFLSEAPLPHQLLPFHVERLPGFESFPPPTSWVTLGKLLSLSVLGFLICQWNTNSADLRGSLGGLKGFILEQPEDAAWHHPGLPAALPHWQVASEAAFYGPAPLAGLLCASPTQPRVLSPPKMMGW